MKYLIIMGALLLSASMAHAAGCGSVTVNPVTGQLDCIGTATGGGSGTVTSVSVTTANGVSGSVATATTTPAITLALGAITPTTVTASGAISSGTAFPTGTGTSISATTGISNTAITLQGLATPATPTVTPTCSGTCLTTYTYVVVAKLTSGAASSGSPPKSTTVQASTLDGSHFNAVSWTAVTNAATYDVYRTVGGATSGIITNTASTSVNDTGLTGDGSTPPNLNSTGVITGPYLNVWGLGGTGGTFAAFPTPAATQTLQLHQYAFGWQFDFLSHGNTSANIAEFAVPQFFSVRGNGENGNNDPYFAVRDVNDAFDISLRMNHTTNIAEIGVGNVECCTVTNNLGIQFNTNDSGGKENSLALNPNGTIGSFAAPFTALTDGATVTWAMNSSVLLNATLTFTTHGGSRTLNITNPVTGGSYVVWLKQDGTGGEGLTLGTGCTWKVSGGGSGAITPSTGAAAIDVLAFTYDGTNCYANFNKNFN